MWVTRITPNRLGGSQDKVRDFSGYVGNATVERRRQIVGGRRPIKYTHLQVRLKGIRENRVIYQVEGG
jgi:hypothetical protein